MKKTVFALAGWAFLLFQMVCVSSCKMSEEEQEVKEVAAASTVFHATIENAANPETKVFTDAALHVLWNADDRVTIFPKNTRNKQYRFKGMDGASGGDFEEVSSGFGTGTDIASNYAVYPYDENTTYVFDDIVRAYFPRTQSYRADSFGPGANLMVSKSGTTDLPFKNVGGYLCLKLYGEGFSVRSVLLKGNGGETLSGPVKVSFDTENIPSMTFDTDTPTELSQEIILNTETPVALGSTEADAVTFWMVVPPVSLTGGFTVTIIDSKGGIHEKSTGKSMTFERNHQTVMKAFQLQDEALAPLSPGIYPFTGSAYTYDKTSDQVNIYEAEGNTWVRFLLIPTLTLYEIGPIPSGVVAGTTIVASVSTYVNGVKTESKDNCKLTVQSLSAGMMNMVSDEGARYVFRF